MKLDDIKKNFSNTNSLTDGREKMNISELYGTEATIVAYQLVRSDKYNGNSAIVILKEYPNHFHFAGKLEYDLISAIDCDDEARAEFIEKGIVVKYTEATGKNGQKYTKIIF